MLLLDTALGLCWPQSTGSDFLASVYALISGRVNTLHGCQTGTGASRGMDPAPLPGLVLPPLESRALTTYKSLVEALPPNLTGS